MVDNPAETVAEIKTAGGRWEPDPTSPVSVLDHIDAIQSSSVFGAAGMEREREDDAGELRGGERR